MFRILALASFLTVLIPAPAAWAAAGDAAVRQAHKAYAARKPADLERAARDVPSDHVLAPYVELWRLLLAGGNSDARIRDFLARQSATRAAELLRADWLKSVGAREAWGLYLAEYARLQRPEVVHQCYAYRAEWAQGNRSRQRDAVALWFTGSDLPAACTPLFNRLADAGLIGQEDVWRRVRMALEAGNVGVARAAADLLPAAQRPNASRLDEAVRDPARVLGAGKLDLTQRGDREIALYALDQLARRSSSDGEAALRRFAAQLGAEEQRVAWGRLATAAARRHEPAALGWFREAGPLALSDFQREWWARTALRQGDWPVLQRAIASMTEPTRTQPVWQYWNARALQATGQRAAATPVFLDLSRQHHYYGQLAQEELGTVAGPLVNVKPAGNHIATVAKMPGIVRALALYDLGLRSEAVSEWIWAIQGLSDAELLAAAELARRREWYDRAINTAEKTREQHDFELRFLAPYRELAQAAARENALDEAWVFGLMRQESRFINVARSSVGASGLMQIMPSTARWIAKQLGVRKFHPDEMQDPARNIQFGSYYLKHIQSTLDGSAVLATAAYNAGPSRAQRWRSEQPMEAAVYIESIPFAETRDYVKKVMSNAMYYAVRFDQPSVLLKDRLGTVPPRRTAAVDGGAPLVAGRAAD